MGFGCHSLAHYRRIIVVFKPFGEFSCGARETPSQDVGCRHGAACRDDELDRGVL